ncbi:MAG: hypothetical protein BGO05_25315 [Rhizobiales bacterium 63-7]|nr:MAG: hypothetical protein BGO05_25315 [Rhizobiales bacterium 63-7]
MSITRLFETGFAAIAGCLMILGLAAKAEAIERLPKNTVPLTADEVRRLYADKTWQWSAGAGRFIAKDRRFIAYSEEGGKPTIAEGRWEVTDHGRLCMNAVWSTPQDKARNRTCFRLVRDRGTVYQRREPKGNWFVLRSFKPRPEDEAHKLVAQDTVSPNIERLKPGMK